MSKPTDMRPQISFEHVLSELSVNRLFPCEILRELISNSYDATATEIKIFPLLDSNRGVIFFDNGTGLSRSDSKRGITPYEAFFSIGKSTKLFGESIGYKCQGSKLCFASDRVLVLTKTETDANWWFKSIDAPKDVLKTSFLITPDETVAPWEALENSLKADTVQSRPILEFLGQDFFKSHSHGTLILVIGLHIENFNSYFAVNSVDSIKESYLYNYIRLYTKHGDTRVATSKHGFRPDHLNALKNIRGSREVELSLWVDDELHSVRQGYRYLLLSAQSQDLSKTPLEYSRLRDGRFCARHVKVLKVGASTFTLIMAVDGNRRALDGFSSLGRRGKRNCGLKLSDQRGTFVSAQGVKICSYNEIFELPALQQYSVLKDPESQSHFSFFIDGSFSLVTNRNSLSPDSMKEINDAALLTEIKTFLDDFFSTSIVFRELCGLLRRERMDDRRDVQVDYLNNTKEGVSERERFQINTIPALANKWFVSPEKGEEHWVGVLYTLLGHFVPDTSPMKSYWLRTLTFAGQGIDSVCQSPGKSLLAPNDLSSLEYKYQFCHSDIYNHLLSITDYLVCWGLDEIETFPARVCDEYDCFGEANPIAGVSSKVAVSISDIKSAVGDSYGTHAITVICLRELIIETFGIKMETPSKALDKKKKK